MKKQLLCISMMMGTSAALAQISSMNDEFNNSAALSNWQNINTTEQWNAEQLEVLDINATHAGSMVQRPYTCTWYSDYKGPIIYKNVTGDFIFTTHVLISNRAGNGNPSSIFSLGGVMVRTPRNFPNGALGANGWTTGGENYVFLSLGYGSETGPGNPGAPPHLEVKTTINSNSILNLTPVNVSEANIRVARIGNAFIMLYQLQGGSWVVHRRYERNDMPATLQVGLVTYTDYDKVATYDVLFHNSHVLNDALNPDPSTNPFLDFNPDLNAQFDFARFSSVILPPNLKNIDLVNEATDEQLLTLLGYDSEDGCSAPSAISAFGITSKSVITQCTEEGTLNYQVQYKITGTSAWTKKGGKVNTIKVTGLAPCTNYTFRMRAKCDGQWLASSNSTFSTMGCRLQDLQELVTETKLFPNPANDAINLQWYSPVQVNSVQVIITNSLGITVKTFSIDMVEGINQDKIDVDQLPGGIYFLRFGDVILKFMKE